MGIKVRNATDGFAAEVLDANLARDADDIPLLGLTRHIVIAQDRQEAWATARRAYAPWRAAFMRLWDKHGIPPPNFTPPTDFDEFAASGKAIVGTPDEVAVEIRRQCADSGINNFYAGSPSVTSPWRKRPNRSTASRTKL